MYFYYLYFVNISSWKRAGPIIWTNLNSYHSWMISAELDWNWPSGSGEEDFLNSSIYFHCFLIIFPWKRARPFIWKTWIPFTQARFVPSLIEIGLLILKIFFFQFVYVFTQFHNYLPLEKGRSFIWINLNPFHSWMRCFVPSLVEIGLTVLEKKIFKFCQCILAIS